MAICKFFLQGNCRFGDNCKFEHQLGDNFTSIQHTSSTSVLRQPYFNAPPPPKATEPVGSNTIDTGTLVKSVVNDMNIAEKGGQWLLSCYGPCKEQPCFPGFEDQSFEEIRFGYYEGRKNGSLEQYKHQLQMMLQQTMLKLKSLQSPSPDIINLLKSLYATSQEQQPGMFVNNVNASSTFNNPINTAQKPPSYGQQAGSIFAQANQGLFGNKPPETSVFGANPNPQNANIFGGQPGGSFGGNQPQTQTFSKSIFNQPNVNQTGGGSIFGGSPAGGIASGANPGVGNSIFSNAQPNSNSVFAGQQTRPNNVALGQPVLQNTASTFSTQAQTQINQINSNSIFGTQQQNVFSGQKTASPFAQQPSNIFTSPPVQNAPQTFTNTSSSPMFAQQNVYATQNQSISNSPFSRQAKTILNVPQSNIFGNSQLTVTSNLAGGQTQQVDESIYSKPEDLTEDEKKWFDSDDLDIFNIPEKPPTYQMCFRT